MRNSWVRPDSAICLAYKGRRSFCTPSFWLCFICSMAFTGKGKRSVMLLILSLRTFGMIISMQRPLKPSDRELLCIPMSLNALLTFTLGSLLWLFLMKPIFTDQSDGRGTYDLGRQMWWYKNATTLLRLTISHPRTLPAEHAGATTNIFNNMIVEMLHWPERRSHQLIMLWHEKSACPQISICLILLTLHRCWFWPKKWTGLIPSVTIVFKEDHHLSRAS